LSRGVVLPSPSSPDSLLPQQYARLSVATAQVCLVPALTWRKLCVPATGVGVS
jgi:hypothetical protein